MAATALLATIPMDVLLMQSAVVDFLEAAVTSTTTVGYVKCAPDAGVRNDWDTSYVRVGLPTKAAADASSVDSKNKQRVSPFILNN